MENLAWVVIIFAVVILLIFIFSFFYNRNSLIHPSQCLSKNAEYSALTGYMGETIKTCYGQGVNPSTGECTFATSSLYSALILCSNNPQACQGFIYRGTEVSFIDAKNLVPAPDSTSVVFINNFYQTL